MDNFHDYMIEHFQIGPRRELVLSLRDPRGPTNHSWGKIRFSAILDFSIVRDWFQGNEDVIDHVNDGKRVVIIDSILEETLGSAMYTYELCIDGLDRLTLQSRRIQEETRS